MKSRMDRYSNNLTTNNRTDKNKELYKEVEHINLNIPRTYSNSKVIDEFNKSIDIDKIKRYIEKMNSPEKETRTRINDIEIDSSKYETVEEEKEYDLNSVLEKARKQREVDYEQERSRKINYSYEDILEKIQRFNNKEQKEEKIIDEELNTNERTLVSLINTLQMKDDELFEDLKGNDNTQVLGSIEEMANDESFKEELKKEITRSTGFSMSFSDGFGESTITKTETTTVETTLPEINLDNSQELTKTNSFYTTSDIFDKSDFNEEIGEDNEDDEDNEKTSPWLITGIVIAVITLVAILVVLANYIFELGLF